MPKGNDAAARKQFADPENTVDTRADSGIHRVAASTANERAAQLGIWEWDPARDSRTYSPDLHRIFGTDPSDRRAVDQWAARVHSDDVAMVRRSVEEGRRTGQLDFEYRYLHPELGLRWLQCKGWRSDYGPNMFGVVIDITERRRVQEASERLAAIVASSDDAIVSKDLHGIVTSWNPAAERIFGYTAQEMIGRSITTVIPEELLDDEKRILSSIARGQRIDHFETVRVRKSGERINVSLTVSPVMDSRGNIVGAAKIARDITERKRAEQALRTSEKLASVGRLAATIAHEVNNPLEAVTNLVYLAKHTEDREQVDAYLATAEEELQRISQLTKQTLGFYRDTRGATTTTLGSIVLPLLSVFSSKARNKGITICPEVRQDPEIIAVPGELRQLTANLLSNSVDAVGSGGRIIVRVEQAREWNGRRHGVRLTVADTGPGIPPDIRARVFEPFFTTKKEIGTGLGLWVCKTIVEKHGGHIRVRSNVSPGRSGTVLTVFLPRTAQLAAHSGMRRAG